MVIVPEKAGIARQIFSDYLSGMGLQRISKKLMSTGYFTPYMKQWSQNAVSDILRNEKYMGDMLLQKSYRENFRTKKKRMITEKYASTM